MTSRTQELEDLREQSQQLQRQIELTMGPGWPWGRQRELAGLRRRAWHVAEQICLIEDCQRARQRAAEDFRRAEAEIQRAHERMEQRLRDAYAEAERRPALYDRSFA
jgi:prefoldin subunit 5